MAYNGVGAVAITHVNVGNSDARNAAIRSQECLEDIKDFLRRLSDLGEYHNYDDSLFKIRHHIEITADKVRTHLQEAEARALKKHEEALVPQGFSKVSPTYDKKRRRSRYGGVK